MSLTRRMLKAMGIDDEKVDQIIEAHTETVEALKAERDDARDKSASAEKLAKENATLKAQIAEQSDDGISKKYADLKAEYEKYKADVANEKETAIKKDAYRELLKKVGISESRVESVMRVTDLNGIKVKDGKIEDSDKIEESIKTEWKDFIVTTQTQGSPVVTPPANNNTNYDAMSDEDFYKATYEANKKK